MASYVDNEASKKVLHAVLLAGQRGADGNAGVLAKKKKKAFHVSVGLLDRCGTAAIHKQRRNVRAPPGHTSLLRKSLTVWQVSSGRMSRALSQARSKPAMTSAVATPW